MSVLLTFARERRVGLRYVAAHPAHRPGLPLCLLLAMLSCAVAQAEESVGVPPFVAPPMLVDPPPADPAPVAVGAAAAKPATPDAMAPPRMVIVDDDPDLPIPVHASHSAPLPASGDADHVAVNLASIDRVVERFSSAPRPPLHVDDASTATRFVDGNARSMALSLDAPLSRGGNGLTLQSRVEMAYRPGVSPTSGNWDAPPGEATATGLAVRLYGSKPTRLNGVYPFVEADWWQDNRAKVININGTRIDTDLLRGLFSFNIGAHSNSITGLKLWVKARGGRNPGGTLGARYRW